MHGGFIKIYRSIKKHWIWENDEYLKAWLDILMMVNHKDQKILFNTDLIIVKRGERITSQLKLSKRWGWSRTKVRNFLELLEKDEMIATKRTSKSTTIKVLNYNVYQENKKLKKHQKEQQKNIKRTTEKHQKNTNKNDKECIKNDKHTHKKKSVCDQETIEIIKLASENHLSESDIRLILKTTKSSSDKLLEKIEYMKNYEKDIGNVNAFLISAIKFDWKNNAFKKDHSDNKNNFHNFTGSEKSYSNDELIAKLCKS